jgi:hypothetical protein
MNKMKRANTVKFSMIDKEVLYIVYYWIHRNLLKKQSLWNNQRLLSSNLNFRIIKDLLRKLYLWNNRICKAQKIISFLKIKKQTNKLYYTKIIKSMIYLAEDN